MILPVDIQNVSSAVATRHSRLPSDAGGTRTLSLVVLLASLAASFFAVLLLLVHPDFRGVRFRTECVSFILVAAALAAAGTFSRRVPSFRIAHAARFVMLFIVCRILKSHAPLIPFLVASPFLVDTVLYEAEVYAVMIDAAALVVLSGALLFPLPDTDVMSTLITIAVYQSIGICIAALGFCAVRYREKLAQSTAEIVELNTAVENLVKANMDFQLYANNVESESADRERNRITRELHDTIGYALTNVIIMMNAGRVLLKEDPAALGDLLEKTRGQSEKALTEMRQILHHFREIRPYEPIGLKALAHLVKSFHEATGLDVRLHLGNLPWSFGRSLDSAIFRLVQQGLTNAFQHGKADMVRISLWQTETGIVISILDNGVGISDEGGVNEGIGLAGIRERLSVYGAQIRLQNVADGCELRAEIPYRVGGIGGEDQGPDR